MTSDAPTRPTRLTGETFTAVWRGIALEIVYDPYWLALQERFGLVSLTVRSLDRSPLPVTETGYRSLFPSADAVAAYDHPVAFVLAWLDEESHTWRNRPHDARQPSLF